jgi:hypothetical protein
LALLKYQIGIEGQDKLRNVMRSIETEAESNARRGYTRDQRVGQQRVRIAQQSGDALAAAEQRTAAKLLAAREREERRAGERRERDEQRRVDRIRRYEERQNSQFFANRHRMEQRAARDMERARQNTANSVRSGAARVFSGTAGVIGGGIRAIGGVGALLGGIGVANAVQTQMSEQAMASRLANQAGTPGIKKELLREAQGVKGFTGAEVLSGMGSFVDLTGDLDTARALAQDMAKLSLSTGSSMENIGAAAGNFANNLKGIKDPGERALKIMEAMRALGGQGSVGAIELKDLAAGGAQIGAAAGQYSGDATENIKKAGVLAQAARAEGGASSADEALTSLGRFNDMVIQNADKLKKLGINAVERDKDGTIKSVADPRQLMADIFKGTKGDLGKINELFDVRGSRVVRGFSKSYERGGTQGVLDRFDELMKTEMSQKRIDTGAQSRYEDADVQGLEAMKDFNREVGEKLVPELTKLIPKFTELTPRIAELIPAIVDVAESLIGTFDAIGGNAIAKQLFESFKSYPLSTIVGGFIIKELAAAGISAAIEAGMTRIMAMMAARAAGGTATSVAGDVIGGGGAAKAGWLSRLGPVGAAAGAIGLGLGAAALGTELYQQSDYGKEQLQKSAKAKSDFYGYGVYAGVVPAGSKEQIHDPSFVKNVQATLGVSGDQTAQIDAKGLNEAVAGLKSVAAEQRLAAAEIKNAATALENVSPARSVPLLFRQ